ncbi:hypothetical protein M8J75_005263 [Diaphorina citri]|nr:hypothetical protein M8J75_002054 [Diaphorina citri]KAI5712041.1 hypothetical protein M8J75_005263 [Diaphorina citri]
MDPLQDPLDDLDGGVGVFENNIREAKVMMSLTRRPNSEMDDGRDNRQACKKSLTHLGVRVFQNRMQLQSNSV